MLLPALNGTPCPQQGVTELCYNTFMSECTCPDSKNPENTDRAQRGDSHRKVPISQDASPLFSELSSPMALLRKASYTCTRINGPQKIRCPGLPQVFEEPQIC